MSFLMLKEELLNAPRIFFKIRISWMSFYSRIE